MRKKEYNIIGYIALCVVFIIVIWNIVMRLIYPKDTDRLKKIEEGDYRYISNENTRKHLERIFSQDSNDRNYIYEWIYKDINGDGKEDLILQEEYVYTKNPRIVDIFSLKDEEVVHIYSDYMDAGYYCQLCDAGIMYYEQFYGKYDYEQYILFHYDKDWNEVFDDGLSLYYLLELEEGQEDYSIEGLDMEKEQLYYWEFDMQEGEKEYTELKKEEWIEKFYDLFGRKCEGEVFKYHL